MGFRLRKSQVAMEFVMLIMLAFMIMIVFTIFAKDKMIDLRNEEEYAALQDVALTVQSEINIATSVQAGYERTFTLPALLEGVNYTLEISSNFLVAESENHEYTVRVASVAGNATPGTNTIRKEDGAVYLNE